LLREGKLIVYPTDTLYGLGADIFNEDAVRRVYEVKARPFSMPLSIMLSSPDEIKDFAFLNPLAERIIDAFMPGAITVILKKKGNVPDVVAKDKVGIRVANCEVARSIAMEVKMTATSANVHGGREPCSIEVARRQLGENVALYLDYGETPCIPSTIVDVAEGKIKIIREGKIGREEIYGAV